jgi:hypothetical protein
MTKHLLDHFRVHPLCKKHTRTCVAECVEGSPDYFCLLCEGAKAIRDLLRGPWVAGRVAQKDVTGADSSLCNTMPA